MSKYKQLLRELNYIEDVDDNNLVQNLLRACWYKYFLVCVDIANSKCDAEPIKYKYPYIVWDALKRIYDRKILEIPTPPHLF
jgi:hypothetical protein